MKMKLNENSFDCLLGHLKKRASLFLGRESTHLLRFNFDFFWTLMIPVSDLSRDALTKVHQEYANRESAQRALGAYADDVILSGIVTLIASEGKEVKSKKNPAWEGFVSRTFKIILDQDCIEFFEQYTPLLQPL